MIMCHAAENCSNLAGCIYQEAQNIQIKQSELLVI